jgi:hypothetical protein
VSPQSGIPADCDAYAIVPSGQGCYDFAAGNGITLASLCKFSSLGSRDGMLIFWDADLWNPVLDNACDK